MRRGSIVAARGDWHLIAGGIATAVALVPTVAPRGRLATRRVGSTSLFWFVIAICIVDLRGRRRGDDLLDPQVPGRARTTSRTARRSTGTRASRSSGRSSRSSSSPRSRSSARSSSPGTTPQAQNILRVNVTAQQFAWSFSYPDAKDLTSRRAAAAEGPLGRALPCTRSDVIHSFWVPEFSQKEDTVPGIVTQLHITPNRLGTFPVICTELCGLGHSLMRTPGDRDDARRVRQVARSSQSRPAQSTLARTPAISPAAGRLQEQRLRRLPHADAPRARRQRSGRTSTSCRSTRETAEQPLETSSASRSSTRTRTSSRAIRRTSCRHVRQALSEAAARLARPVSDQSSKKG